MIAIPKFLAISNAIHTSTANNNAFRQATNLLITGITTLTPKIEQYSIAPV